MKKLVFKDQGREPPQLEQRDESEVQSGDEDMSRIEEEDSLDFESSRRSKTESLAPLNNQPTPPDFKQ